MTLHVCPGPSCVTAWSPDDRETRWCFHCRKRLPHTWMMLDDPPERQPSYHEPVPVLKCSRCKRDCTEFPGVYRDGPHYPSERVWRHLVNVSARHARDVGLGCDLEAP